MNKPRVKLIADGYFFKFRKYARIPHALQVMEVLKKLSLEQKELLCWLLSKMNGTNSVQIHFQEGFAFAMKDLIRLIQLDVIIPFASEGRFSIDNKDKIKLMLNPARFIHPKVYSAERRTNNYKNQKKYILREAPKTIVELYKIRDNIDFQD